MSTYHWLNNLSGVLRQISRVDSLSILGPKIPFVLLYTGQTTEGSGIDYGKQAAKMCLLLEKKLITAIEITTQRGKTKVKRRKLTFMQIFQSANAPNPDEKVRSRQISDQHFIRHPSPRIQSLIGSYASTIQKELNLKQAFDARNKRQSGKTDEKTVFRGEEKGGEGRLPGELTSRGGKVALPEVNGGVDRAKSNGWGTDREGHTAAKTERKFEAELKEYVTGGGGGGRG